MAAESQKADATCQVFELLHHATLNERLLNAVISISGCATLEEALEPLLDAALDVTQMDGGGVYWVEGDTAVLRHSRGLSDPFIREVRRMPLAPLPVQTLLHQREPVEVAETSAAMRELLRRHGIRHAFSFPLRARNALFGFLNVGSTRPEPPARADIQALQILVSEIESLFFRLYSEKALRESEEWYRALWESALDGVVLYDLLASPREGGTINVNDAICRMLGYAREELLRLSPLDLIEEKAREAIPGLIAGILESGRVLFEITLVARDGRRVPVEINASVIRSGARRVALLVIRDVTARRQAAEALRESEERFSAFMDNSPAIAWMRDEQGRYVYLSRTYVRHSGRKLEEYRGKTVFDLWPREIAEGFWKIDQDVLRTGRPVELIEEVPAPDGGREYWRNFKFPFQDASGRRFVGGIGVDVTERKQMMETLQQMNERLEEQVQTRTRELSRTIERLQGAMTELEHRTTQLQKLTLELVHAEDCERNRLAEFLHDDLQQTLAAAKFHVGILGGRIQGDGRALQAFEQTMRMLKEAIAKSRDLSRELGPPVLCRGDLEAVFEWLAGQMEHQHGLTVHVDIRHHANSNSEPVRSFLYRAAREILFNAVKHAGVGEIKLRLQRVHQELWLTLSDRGRGFEPASLAQSAGFGLPTIRERVELLGGRMEIKSAPGRGSIFFLAVPDAGA